jgi:hypothetical protein
MKIKINHLYFLLSIMLLVTLSSCRTEDDLVIDPPTESIIEPNSTIADLIRRVAANDGSDDNIIDNASNLLIQLPISVEANGVELEIIDSTSYEAIEDIFNLSNVDVDEVIISYPITVILPDYSIVVVSSDSELDALRELDSDNDEDIECIDFIYPVLIAIFNEENESIDSVILDNDIEMYSFIENLETLSIVTLNFPINMIFADESIILINNLQELENEILAADNTCDEEDDYYGCGSNLYTVSELENIFEVCSEWTIGILEIDNNDVLNTVVGYVFTFNNDGTILVLEDANVFNGTWVASGSQGEVTVTINVAGLPIVNDTWDLCYLSSEPNDKKVELRIGTDRMRFVSDCLDEVFCDNPQVTGLPYRLINTAGEFCLEIPDTVLYFNSWGIDVMEINGVDFTNQWVHLTLPSFPEAVNGKYYVSYTASNVTESGVDIGTVLPNYISCVNPTEISVPFSFDGAGELCWVTTEDIISIISSNTTVVEVNGVNITNETLDTNSINFPDKIDGKYFIRYESTVASGHFEAGLELIQFCNNPQVTGLPYRLINTAGEFCLEIPDSVLYFNSWGIDVMEINGVDFTNQWVHSSLPSFPEAVNGKYYVSYTASNVTESGVDIGTVLPNYISCVNPSEIGVPFNFDGAGTFCWVTTQDIISIISSNTTVVEVNGVNITNEMLDTTSINFPDKIDGKYFIRYESTVASGHFEAGLDLLEIPSDLELAFEACEIWRVNQISINLIDLLGLYIGHEFTFNTDGTVDVSSLIFNYSGTWEITGTQDTVQFLIIDIPGLSDFSDTWTVDGVDLVSEPMTIDLSSGNNSLTFESNCN